MSPKEAVAILDTQTSGRQETIDALALAMSYLRDAAFKQEQYEKQFMPTTSAQSQMDKHREMLSGWHGLAEVRPENWATEVLTTPATFVPPEEPTPTPLLDAAKSARKSKVV